MLKISAKLIIYDLVKSDNYPVNGYHLFMTISGIKCSQNFIDSKNCKKVVISTPNFMIIISS